MVLKKARSVFGGSANDTEKHTALIDEFKLAHKKMFQNHSLDLQPSMDSFTSGAVKVSK